MGAVRGFTLNKFSISIIGACGLHDSSLATRAGKGVLKHFMGRRRYETGGMTWKREPRAMPPGVHCYDTASDIGSIGGISHSVETLGRMEHPAVEQIRCAVQALFSRSSMSFRVFLTSLSSKYTHVLTRK